MEAGQGRKAANVLLLPYPSQGHLNPLLQFGKRLASKGLTVSIACTTFIARGLPPHLGSIKVETISDGFDAGGFDDAGTVDAYLQSLEVAGSATLAAHIREMARADRPVRCLVYDAFFPWALDVARKLGILAAAFFTQNCSVDAIYYQCYHRSLQGLEAGPTVSLPGLPPLEIDDFPSFIAVPGSYPAYFALVVNQFSNVEKADWVLFNSFYDLEPEVMDWMAGLWPVKAIGPTVPAMFVDNRIEGDREYGISLWNPNSATCMKWLDARSPASVIYVSFGSMVSLRVDQMKEIALALQESNYHFLWVVRAPEEDKLPAGFREETQEEKGLIVSWSPQLEVLAHPSVGCFFTHSGWNSTLEGLCLGVPMVVFPQWTDQPTNAKLVEEVWRVGVRARADERGVLRKETVLRCVEEVMQGREMRENARRWKETARRAIDRGGRSDKDMDDFVAALLG